jgi:hypothetical protein
MEQHKLERVYTDKNGYEVGVSTEYRAGIGIAYCSLRKLENEFKKVRSPRLPYRQSLDQALVDLDLYATHMGWKRKYTGSEAPTTEQEAPVKPPGIDERPAFTPPIGFFRRLIMEAQTTTDSEAQDNEPNHDEKPEFTPRVEALNQVLDVLEKNRRERESMLQKALEGTSVLTQTFFKCSDYMIQKHMDAIADEIHKLIKNQ